MAGRTVSRYTALMGGDSSFTGNIPELYQRHLVPLLFQPWADVIAERIASLGPSTILETAAGTGVVTASLSRACPDARITATDLNSAMLETARRTIGETQQVEFVTADALDLPFADQSFDASASQFGIMFYPDRVRGYAETRRVLKDGGTMIAATWGSLDDNPVSKLLNDALARAFPADPPAFLARTPFSYFDVETIVDEAERGGFTGVVVESVTLPHPPAPIEDAVIGLCLGSPLRAELEERGPDGIERALAAGREALNALADGDGRVRSTMTAIIITATR